ncbi:SDR family NAD(P)-dependent oxidoreductase [Streptomyces sp. NPDC004838]
MDGSDAGRVVLVTGGSRGIGAAIVDLLATRGVRVGCSYRSSRHEAERLAARHPGRVLPVHYELGDADSAAGAVSALVGEFGRLDGLVANAGVWNGGRLDAMDEAEWARVASVNVLGVAQVCRAALPHLVVRRGSSITVVTSVVGLIGGAGDTAYASGKAGLIGFCRSLAKESARAGVRVNALAPGFVETDMTAQVSGSARDAIGKQILLRRFGTPEEIARAAVFLSEDATYCTGTTLTVDGGWST